jgi:adenylosuccinate synthase
MHLAIIGSQSGDEGKGKFVDRFAGAAELVVRFQGGPHTGHTVVTGQGTTKFVQVPAGVAQGVTNVVAGGCVVDLVALLAEIDALEAAGWRVDLRIADTAHVVFPYHRAQDAAMETWRGGDWAVSAHNGLRDGTGQIGSTKTGVGPCREDKIARIGLRMADLLDESLLRARLPRLVALKRRQVAAIAPEVADDPAFDWDAGRLLARYAQAAERLRPRICDTATLLQDAHRAGRRMLFEGAQSVGLDVEQGTYPFCSSGYSAASGIPLGCGLPMDLPVSVCGVVKAYMTQVGGGPMPTALADERADAIARAGHEYGTVTGRRRRIGWLDLPFVRRGLRRDGTRRLCVSCVDVLAGLEDVYVATHYTLDGEVLQSYPSDLAAAARVVPHYRRFPGWPPFDPDRAVADGWTGLPPACRTYLNAIAELLQVEIVAVGVGRARAHTLDLADPYAPRAAGVRDTAAGVAQVQV